MAGHGKPAMSGFNMFFPSLDMTISLHEQLRYGPMKGGPLEQSQQWKLSDDSKYSRQNPPTQKTKKKSCFNKYFIRLFYGAKLNHVEPVPRRSQPSS